jgi:anti-sigma regulatory factor (Ser/Thr protein kinase)
VSQARHTAFVYDDDAAYVDRTVDFLRQGLDAGEGIVVANLRDRLGTIREALGADAEQATFVDVTSLYTRPARTVAAYYRMLSDLLEHHRSVRLIAEVQYGPTPTEWNEWIAYEATVTHASAALPVWIACTYDARETPEDVLDGVWNTHSEVLTHDWQASATSEEPVETVRRLTPHPEPIEDLRPIATGEDLGALRERLAAELAAAEVPSVKVLDMLVAATEIAANARDHGGGIAEVRVGAVDGRFVCEIADRGEGFDHTLAGYRTPDDGHPSGIWIARQRTWRLEYLDSEGAFTARLWL